MSMLFRLFVNSPIEMKSTPVSAYSIILFFPILFWVYKTGPFEFIFIITPIIKNNGIKKIINKKEKTISKNLLIFLYSKIQKKLLQ